MIKFVTFTNVDPVITPIVQEFIQNTGRSKAVSKPTQEPVQKEASPAIEEPTEVEPVIRPTTRRPSIDNTRLIATDIEDIFKQAGLVSINRKQIKFGNKALRDQNVSFGAKNSNHKKRDPHTGNAMARDISIIGGNLDDYIEFRKQIMSNELISKYLDTKGWGIINEVTPQILARTRGTGMHFHFGPDTWARRTWSGWRSNPNAPITQVFKQGGRFIFKKSQMVKDAERLNGKRDMRKKLVKSDVITNKKKRIQKGQEGLKFATYTPIETPVYEPVDPFSDYNFPSTYKEYLAESKELVQQIAEQTPEQPTEQTGNQEESPKQKSQEVVRIANHIYKDRNKWVKDLRKAYIKAGITNENALKMLIAQDALESGWGKSAQGKFNYGNLTAGKSWRGETVNGKDSDGKGNPIKQKFRSYNSIEEYAADKVQFLKTLYDFNENDNINTFSHKLQGGNKGSRKYAASPRYVQSIINVYNNLK